MAMLEHVNVTVADPAATAEMLCDLFGWRIRWEGDAMVSGHTKHVGGDDFYLAIFSPGETEPGDGRYQRRGALNHLGVVVDDLDGAEEKVKAHGYTPVSHAAYEPGRRFYFTEENGIEIEVVSYA
ncbi:VOC family protein [Aestuariibius sp. 2305UL40-4]|uniref:VOC family protein n=1 Tax=Aestuariibius violaceus TaxID=3234132 RepID=UPI00345E5EF3